MNPIKLYIIFYVKRMSPVSFPDVFAVVVVFFFVGLFSMPFKFVLGMHDFTRPNALLLATLSG